MNKTIALILTIALLVTLTACAVPPNAPPNINGDTPPPLDVETDEGVAPPSENGDDVPPSNGGSEGGGEHHIPEDPPVTTPIVPQRSYSEILIVTARRVNVRAGKSSKHKVLGTMKKGEGLAVISRDESGWYEVHYRGKHAYIHGSNAKIVYIERSTLSSLEKVISEGERLMGFPYVYGAPRYHWESGVLNKDFRYGEFDCSSLMQYIFRQGADIRLGITTRHQVYDGVRVRGEIKRGDVLFFTNDVRRNRKGVERVGHVGLYLGDGYMLHTASDYAVIEEISKERWNNYLVAKRMM